MASKKVAVVVTTAHKGVFFGYGEPSDKATIRIEKARMCIYWSQDVKGILGLAATGPSKSSRVGPAVPALTLRDVTSVIEASEDATKAWEGGPWA
jgi:hypothetical protein